MTTRKVEFRVRPVTRYVVTRYEEGDNHAGSSMIGTYDSGEVAYQVGYALCKAEHDRSGQPPGSMDFIYPQIPAGVSVSPPEFS